MADAAVEFLLENLTQLLKHHIDLIRNIESEVLALVTNVNFFKSFLRKVSSKKLRKDGTLRALVGEIRSVIYDADDVMDAYVTQAAEKRTKYYFTGGGLDLIGIAKKVNDICNEINKIYGDKDKFDLVNFDTDDGQDEKPVQPKLRQTNVVGLEDEVEKIVGYLNDKTEYLDVISIIGMPGLGKTTLTGKIFHDDKIQSQFPICIWVYVSSEFTEKEVFLSILKQLRTKLDEDEYGKKREDELAKEIAEELERGKFLLVMDDVWEPKDWEKLKVVLPKHNTMGKVMITSRHEAVGLATQVDVRAPLKLRSMNQDESCRLLHWEVFNKPEFPAEFKKVGEEIAGKCGGLPLAIVVIGGVLKTKFLGSANWWKKVSGSVPTFIDEDEALNRMDDVISMSYQKLPYHLKECFLYLGMFPEDFEIPAWKLIRMWIAEGLIESKGSITMEERGEFYLEELISRNLIKVDRLNSDGSVKTCRMHDMLGAFCKRQGGKDGDDFLQEIKESGDGGLQFTFEKERRLCIHSNVASFLSKTTKGACVRSFVTFSKDVEMPKDKISAIFEAFKMLRVLEAKALIFSKIPSDFFHLVHLRYLVLSLKLDTSAKRTSLPPAFKKLWNLQTLVVETTSRFLDIKANIMTMAQLKHVKTNASITLDKAGKNNAEGEKLQTLCNMLPGSCTEEILGKARNLKKLGIRGAIGSFLDGKVGSIKSLSKLIKLEKLKLWNDVFPIKPSSGKLDALPKYHQFPPALKSLTLVATYLDWTKMSVLESLENLEVLKLKDNACMGSKWSVDQGGFNSLNFLLITRTDLETWEASAHHFPMLKRLELHNCENLKKIPTALADIPQFQLLKLRKSEKAASSALEIAAAKKNVPTFELSIL